jgi:hypothetical protein
MPEAIQTTTTLIPLSNHAALNLPWGPRTIDRRIKEDPDFPPIIRLGCRRFVEADALEQYRRILVERGKATPPQLRSSVRQQPASLSLHGAPAAADRNSEMAA